MTALAVEPLTTITDTPRLASQANRATSLHICLLGPIDTVPEQFHTIPVVAAGALVQLLETHAVLQCAVVYEIVLGNGVVLVRHAHCEAEVGLGVRVEVGGAELEDVAEALSWTVHAEDAVVVVCCAARGVSRRSNVCNV